MTGNGLSDCNWSVIFVYCIVITYLTTVCTVVLHVYCVNISEDAPKNFNVHKSFNVL